MARENQLNIRNFPADLKKKLQALAKQNHRSMTQEIIHALEEYVQRETAQPKK
ncbi:MAG: Arc family DNA-binding protein [Anaerolineae bacterium]|nr:Arc family DNA-binding protein [Anaerolineae bacterium]